MRDLAGLPKHKVELNNHRVVLEDATRENAQQVIQKVRAIGYNITTVKITVPVLQMSCASCASSVQTMLNAQPGVLSAVVNYASSSVMVEYIPSTISLPQMKKVIQSIGYDLMIDSFDDVVLVYGELDGNV